MDQLNWRRIPKGTVQADGTVQAFEWNGAHVELPSGGPLPDVVGMGYACNHGQGWEASLTLYGIKCDDQDMAESAVEVGAAMLIAVRDELVRHVESLRLARALVALLEAQGPAERG